MQTLILNHYPPVIKQIREMQQIAKAEDAEFEKLGNAMRRAGQDMFIFTSGRRGIERFEKLLRITPKASQGLEERRAYILYMMNRRKMSLSELRVLLSGYADGITLKPDFDKEELTVIAEGELEGLEVIHEILDSLLPLQVCIVFEIHINLWRLDGMERLDGGRVLDAEIVKKEYG